ncbi:MAG: hypothetical protein KME52_18420 [Desmonostoc geniculatum HA4340-LM1]|jgi:hypothetical protein|nr:hypothetical protein [Desmonostoc geniculatum HA4340-LM1]
MFTREELFEYFGDRYSPTQIHEALSELAKHDVIINPDAEEFPATITERLEQVLQVVSDAIASNKQLTGSSDLAQIEQTAINLATERDFAIPIDTLKGLIEILDAEAAVEAVTLFQRRKAIREGVLNQLETNAIAAANEQAAKRMDALNKLCSDPEVLDQILQDYGLLSSTEADRQHLELTASCSLDFDTDAFLAEVSSEKKLLPKTVGDTQRLAKSLITRSLR